MPLPRSLARFNRPATNRVLGPLAGITRPFAIVVHRGRRTGRSYETPVWAFRTKDGFVIACTYGADRTEWVKNVMKHGEATLLSRKKSYRLIDPRVVHGEAGRRAMPAAIRPALRALGIDDYLVTSQTQGMAAVSEPSG